MGKDWGAALGKAKAPATDCAAVAACPSIVALQDKVDVLWEASPVIIAEVAQLGAQLNSVFTQLLNLQSQVQAGLPNATAPVIPYNATVCAATNFSDFNSTVGAWVATDWTRAAATGGPGSDQTCAQGQPTATCADVCANLNLRCNPCATARALACQTPLFYALQQAGKSDPDILTAAGKPGQVLNGVPPPPRNGFVGTGCTSVSGAVAGWSDVNIANSQAVCGDGASEPPIQTASWPFTQNFFSPADAGYKTPESACTLPIRGKQPGPNPGDFPLVEYGTVCYCGR